MNIASKVGQKDAEVFEIRNLLFRKHGLEFARIDGLSECEQAYKRSEPLIEGGEFFSQCLQT